MVTPDQARQALAELEGPDGQPLGASGAIWA